MNYVGPFCLVISNGVFKNASDVFNILDPDVGGASTFSVKLSADGNEPPTHWGARTLLSPDAYDALVNMSVVEFKAYIDALAEERGRTPVGSVTAFKASIEVSEPNVNFYEFVDGLGLQRVVEPEPGI